MPTLKLTAHTVEKLPFDSKKQQLYWDIDLTGFGLRVGSKSKVYFCERRVSGKTIRVTLGKHPILSVAEARTRAMKTLVSMLDGVNPIEQRRNQAISQVTLRQAFDDYINRREYEEKTVREYKYAILDKYKELLDIPLQNIDKDIVEKIHKRIGKEVSGQTANKCTRELKAVINYAMSRYEIDGKPVITVNPVDRISSSRIWFKSKIRTRHLKPHHLKIVFEELNAYPNRVMADYILFVMFTGCRRNEAGSLRWDDVSLDNRSFIITADKAKNDNPIELPLTTYLMEIIERRNAERVNEFVFPSLGSKNGYITEPKKVTRQIGLAAGQEFSMHDLRRTYITIAEQLDISQYAVKALVNHKMSKDDVTAGYIQMSVERLRDPMQRITDFILKCAR